MYGRGNGYDVMEVCLNGHKITEYALSQPESRQKFCEDCGAKTIDACQYCSANIRGYLHVQGVAGFFSSPVPKYCFNCGMAYAWQDAAITNLNEILEESELSLKDRQDLDKVLPDVLRDTPKTESASLKVKRILAKVGNPVYEVAIKVIADVASETAKKTLGLK